MIKKTIISFIAITICIINSITLIFANHVDTNCNSNINLDPNSTFLIHKNGQEVTPVYLDKIKLFATKNDYNNLVEYLAKNDLTLSIITDNEIPIIKKAFSVKHYVKICPYRKKYVYYKGQKFFANWNAIIECDFSYNANTYKIGNVYDTKLSLNNYMIGVGLSTAILDDVETPKAKISNDGYSLTVKASYTMRATITQGIDHPILTIGSYTETGIAKP